MAKDFDPFEKLEGDSEEPELRALLATLQEDVPASVVPAQQADLADVHEQDQAEEALVSEINAFIEDQLTQVQPTGPSQEASVDTLPLNPLHRPPQNLPMTLKYVLGNVPMTLEGLKQVQPGQCLHLGAELLGAVPQEQLNIFVMLGEDVVANGHLVLANGGLAIQIDQVKAPVSV